ncbi:MAG TPA: EamA family transporter, partial [Burkholderiales bacterium]
MITQKPALAGTLLLAAAAVAWGGAFPAGKSALGVVDAYYLTAVRYGIAAVVFLGILAWVEGAQSLRFEGKAMKAWGLGTVGFGGGVLLMFMGLAQTRPEHGAVV